MTLQGVWWLPETPEYTAAGTLEFDGTGYPSLDLIGSLKAEASAFGVLVSDMEIILGETSGGKKVTLYKCIQSNRTYTSGSGLVTTRILASYIFVGHHFLAPADLVFERFAVAYDKLADWAWVTGFTTTFISNPETNGLSRWELVYEFPDPHEITAGGVAIKFSPTFHEAGGPISEFRATQTLFLEACPPEPKPFNGYLDIFYHLRNFITLGVGKPIYPDKMQGTLFVGDSWERTRQISIYHGIGSSKDRGKTIHPAKMLFGLQKLGNHYGQAVAAWFEKASTLKPVYDLYFSTLYNPEMYLEGRFLSLAQALETYHRRVAGGTYLNEETYGNLNSAFVDALKGFELERDVHNAFLGKLQFLNELSLRRRIKDVVLSLGAGITQFIPNAGKFASRVVDTRNYLTHYNPDLESHAAQGDDLDDLSELLELLLESCFLREIGLPDEVRASIVSEYQGYRRLA